ncbi:hypothetical protein BY458DRAFT_579286 [Sporodiniella umbellata]|nr:hypothetical protein BY458DRAFT_579286 [Sporodiniella umbellata]
MLYPGKKDKSSVSRIKVYNQNSDLKEAEQLFLKGSEVNVYIEQDQKHPLRCDEHQILTASTTSLIMSKEERTYMYQMKYSELMDTSSPLKNWIKSNKKKGPPLQLTEERFLQYRKLRSSNSAPHTQNKRKSILTSPTYEFSRTPPVPKKSFSAFLKKTILPSNAPSSKRQSKSYSQPSNISEFFYCDVSSKPFVLPSDASKSSRFLWNSSIGRLSSNKKDNNISSNSKDKHLVHEKSPESALSRESCFRNEKNSTSNLSAIVECPNPKERAISHRRSKKIDRPQSTFITSSTPSVFLKKLQRQSIYEGIDCPQIDKLGEEQHCYEGDVSNLTGRLEKTLMSISQCTKPHSQQTEANNTIINEKSSLLDEEKSKKRMSFSIGHSLSSLRFIPQRSHALKRQSMLA